MPVRLLVILAAIGRLLFVRLALRILLLVVRPLVAASDGLVASIIWLVIVRLVLVGGPVSVAIVRVVVLVVSVVWLVIVRLVLVAVAVAPVLIAVVGDLVFSGLVVVTSVVVLLV